ncbi:MAG: hypothetical protein QXT73_02330 [Candidatus Methanomethylicaceae archaeon]
MVLCSNCRKALRCSRNEVVVRMGRGEILQGDEYECPNCGIRVITGFGGPCFPWNESYAALSKEIDVEGEY